MCDCSCLRKNGNVNIAEINVHLVWRQSIIIWCSATSAKLERTLNSFIGDVLVDLYVLGTNVTV